MRDDINIIFKDNMQLIYKTEKTVYFFRIQNFDNALRLTTDIMNQVNSYIEILFSMLSYFNSNIQLINPSEFLEMLKTLLNAQENKDYILLADILELQFVPFLYDLQESIINKEGTIYKDEFYDTSLKSLAQINPSLEDKLKKLPHPSELMKKKYEVEYTSSGFLTLAITDHGIKYYMHSNRDALMEAFYLASSWYSSDKDSYLIYGLGLGYHVRELICYSESLQIEIYESDINIIQLVFSHTDFVNVLNNSNIKLIYDPKLKYLNERLRNVDDATELVIHYPSLRNIRNSEIKEKLEEYFIQYSSIKNQENRLNSNFRKNIQICNAYIDELRDTFCGKDLLIIAAGPSLDKNFIKLKYINKNKFIILATGTVFHKLMNADIIPDYVIVTEANLGAYGQIYGLQNSKVPLLLISTALWAFSSHYKGKKYLICQQGYPKAEEFAKEHGYNLYNTGGSVSTIALDIGIQFRCKRIIFLGLDLAYTDNFVHAEGTSRRNVDNTEGLIQVTDIHGEQIYTTKVLNIYRKWIENRIKNIKEIEFIDATEGGARIEGMRIAKLSEVINN